MTLKQDTFIKLVSSSTRKSHSDLDGDRLKKKEGGAIEGVIDCYAGKGVEPEMMR